MTSSAETTLNLALRGAWPQLRLDDAGWQTLIRQAVRENVAPLLYDQIRRASAVEPPAAALSNLRVQYLRTQASNLYRFSTVGEVLKRLAEAAIPVIVLKGAALAELVYQDPGLRPMVDIDLLVRMSDARQATRLLEEMGFHRGALPELRPGFALQFLSEAELLSPGQSPVMVEIHWRLLAPLFVARFINEEALWQHSRPANVGGAPCRVLSGEDWVAHLAAHAVYKHRHLSLQHIADLDRLIRSPEISIHWERLVSLSVERRWSPAVYQALSQAVESLGTPLPADVLPALAAAPLPRFERYVQQWWLKPGRPERWHIFPDWLTLPGLKARFQVLWAYLFPSRAYILACYPNESPRMFPLLYLRRLFSRTDGQQGHSA